MNSWNIWIAPLRAVWQDLTLYAPKLVAALLVLSVGLILAWIVKNLAGALLRWLKLDEKFAGLWLFRPWSEGLHGHRPSETGANFFFYLIIFTAIILAVRLLGFTFGETILSALLGLLPRVLSFMLILFLGALMAMFFSVVAQVVLAGTSIQHPNFWGKVIAWGTFGVAVFFSLEQLGVVGQFLTWLVLILLSASGLAMALAFGLGCKDLAREFLIELLREERNNTPKV